jgi:preprotein translocase subunit SecE
MANWISSTRTFLHEVTGEMKKVNFPTREETVGTTGVVLVTSAIFALFLWIADRGINWTLVQVFGG